MEEKRVFKGRKRSLSNGAARESSKGTSNSNTAMIESDRIELLRNCPEGLTDQESSPYNNSLIKRKTFLNKDIVWESSIGTSDSETPIIERDKTELLKNCPAG
ncbi:unnamed protein product [Dovyalis caffra]|uniref:Uncharacterized protein n=1 Tax=Dovyalis caffra TaxID=77055 RepID=A0AAV1QP95_9ROSI|nr:unnamed protein product [Dovyalis caffra]